MEDNTLDDDRALALRCAHGCPVALRYVRRRYGADVRKTMLRCRLPAVEIEDAEARLWARLLVGGRRESPRIRSFSGVGTLQAWLRRCATREALTELRRRRVEHDLPVPDVAASSSTPEEALLKHEHARTFQAAFRRAVGSLDARERSVLRESVVDGVPTPEIARRLGVHRVTVARWLAAARTKLARRTARIYRDHFGARANVALGDVDLALSTLL